ncbi:MAG: hypothetical protein HKN61_02115 [Flavobacteriaceae bacterium]|nr:hypothetical protein [Flavobacteriaceae bacterium]
MNLQRCRNFILFALTLLISNITTGQEQDCTLGIGGKDTSLIVQVFQLNQEQQLKLEEWSGEYQLMQKDHRDRVKKLFDTHPQETPSELLKMSEKFALLKEELVTASKAIDQKLLGIFNERQYMRYIELCEEVARRPMQRTD